MKYFNQTVSSVGNKPGVWIDPYSDIYCWWSDGFLCSDNRNWENPAEREPNLADYWCVNNENGER